VRGFAQVDHHVAAGRASYERVGPVLWRKFDSLRIVERDPHDAVESLEENCADVLAELGRGWRGAAVNFPLDAGRRGLDLPASFAKEHWQRLVKLGEVVFAVAGDRGFDS